MRVSLKAKITSRSFCQIIVLTLWTTTNEKSGTECKRSESKSCGLPQITDLALIYDHLLARWMKKKTNNWPLVYVCIHELRRGREGLVFKIYLVARLPEGLKPSFLLAESSKPLRKMNQSFLFKNNSEVTYFEKKVVRLSSFIFSTLWWLLRFWLLISWFLSAN